MQLLHPWLLLGLLLVPAAALLHVFRAPGRRHEVSFLGLWQNVLRRVTPEASERLARFDWLLLLEILVIILLVLALAQPVIWLERPRRHVGFILDLSASMNTVAPDGRSRFQEARARAGDVLDKLSDDDLVSYVAGPPFEHTAFRRTPAEFRKTLASTGPSGVRVVAPSDVAVEPARLLETGLAALGRGPSVVYLVSDKPPVDALKTAGERVRTLTVGGASRNVAILAFAAGPPNAGTYEMFIRVRNFSDRPVARELVLNKLRAAPQRIHLDLSPGATLDQVVTVHPTLPDPVVTAELEGEQDGFAADDFVSAVLRPLVVVALVAKPSVAYARLFGGPVFEDTIYLEAPPDESGAAPRDALVIADDAIPKTLGSTTVILNPPKGEVAGIGIGDAKSLDGAASLVLPLDDPLMRSVNLGELKLDRCRPLTLPPTARPLARLATGPVVAASGEHLGGEVIVLSFDAARAGWPLRPSFVVFWANVLEHARKSSGAGGLVYYRPGDVVSLPLGKEIAELRTPDGTVAVSGDPLGWGHFRPLRTGLYEWTLRGRRQAFAVNLLSETESDNRPSPLVAKPPSLDLPAPMAGTAIPFAPWLCVLAAGLAVTWWHFRR